MDFNIVNLSSLVIVSLIGLERIIERFNLSSVKTLHVSCSKCFNVDIERQNSQANSPNNGQSTLNETIQDAKEFMSNAKQDAKDFMSNAKQDANDFISNAKIVFENKSKLLDEIKPLEGVVIKSLEGIEIR